MSDSVSKLQDQQKLEAAFEQFNAVSGKLIDAYQQLEMQVNVLNQQLDEANKELRVQLDANAALAERLGLLLEALPAGVLELSSDNSILIENPTACRFLGGSVVGLAWPQVMARLVSTDIDQTYRLGEGPDALLLTLQFRDLPAAGGRIVLLHDVTRLNQLSASLARQEKLAAMGSMAASLAHQLRTPLATALLYTANLQKPGLRPEDRDRFIDKSLARLRALEGLIQNMLGFVRGQVSEMEALAVSSLVEELVAVILPPCQNKNINFNCNTGLSSTIKIMGDRKALLGALTNLLENAVHYSPSGAEIRLTVTLQDGFVCFAVEDAGPGVAPEEVERLFEPFYTTRSGGTGLGLAIVKKVAEELGGHVGCRPGSLGGARFELLLPASQ